MAALGCAISPESALEQVLPDQHSEADDDQDDDDTGDGAEDDEAQASDEQADDEDDEGDLDSTKDAVRVNEPDAGASRDAGTVATKDASQSKPDAAAVVVADAASPGKDAATPGKDAGTAVVATCTAGTYAGTFSVDISGGLTRDSFEGSLTLQLSGSGDNLRIQTGSLSGKDAAGNPLTAKVSGSLNCLTKKLEGATVSDGIFEQRGSLISTVRFSGTMAASFTPESSALQGTWTLESSLRTRSGSGRFTAIKQP
jgi:hypothetical protein